MLRYFAYAARWIYVRGLQHFCVGYFLNICWHWNLNLVNPCFCETYIHIFVSLQWLPMLYAYIEYWHTSWMPVHIVGPRFHPTLMLVLAWQCAWPGHMCQFFSWLACWIWHNNSRARMPKEQINIETSNWFNEGTNWVSSSMYVLDYTMCCIRLYF